MAASGKKGRKGKMRVMDLHEFLGGENDAGAGQMVVMAPRMGTSWADEVETEESESYDTSFKEKLVLPTAPRAARGPDIDDDKIPRQPPFRVRIGNLPYDIEESDIHAFFRNLKIIDIRVPRDSEQSRIRGFGYVEFEDRQTLIEALSLNDMTLKNRAVHIVLATGPDDDKRRRGDRDRGMGPMDDGPDRTLGNWRDGDGGSGRGNSFRNGYDDDRQHNGYRGDNDRDRDRDRDRGGMDQFSRQEFGTAQHRSERSDRYSDRGGSRYDDRGPPGEDRYSDRRDRRYGGNRDDYKERGDFGYRDERSGWAGRGGDRPMRSRDYARYGERSDRDRDWEQNRNPEESEPEREAPRERPRLMLQKRTVPLEEAGKPVASSSIFGGAKPVDTTAREREIEDRLAREKEIVLARKPSSEADSTQKEYKKEDRRRTDSDGQQSGDDNREEYSAGEDRSNDAEPDNARTRTYSSSKEEDTEKIAENTNSQTPKQLIIRREDPSAVPAPPPAQNAWTKRADVSHITRGTDDLGNNNGESIRREAPRREYQSRGTDRDRARDSRDSRPNDRNQYNERRGGGDRHGPPRSEYTRGGYSRSSGTDQRRHQDQKPRGMARSGDRADGYGSRPYGSRGSNNDREEYQRQDNSRDRERVTKLEEPSQPNFIASNKFASLSADE